MKTAICYCTLVFLLALLPAGISAQSSGPQATKDSIVYKGVTDNSCALEVQFGSYSAGIDGKAYEKVMALIDSEKLAYTAKNIGREGETRLCLPLTGVSACRKKKLIKQLKTIARSGYLTSISIR